MSRGVLLDTNLILAVFDTQGTTSPEARTAAREQINGLLDDPDVALAISPLIRYEVLRGVPAGQAERFEKLKLELTGFDSYDVTKSEADLAADLWRYAVSRKPEAWSPNKRSFDIAHVACAKVNKLEMTSRDGDIPQLLALYEEMKKEAI